MGVNSATNPLPDSLGIGENFPPKNLWLDCAVFRKYTDSFGRTGFSRVSGTFAPIDPSKGNLTEIASDALANLAWSFKPSGGGAEEYQIGISLRAELAPKKLQAFASQRIPGAQNSFKLRDGKIPEELLKVHLGYQDYLPYYVPGLTEVTVTVRSILVENGVEVHRGTIYDATSSNGVSDPTCNLYVGQPSYFGPDVLQLQSFFVVPEQIRNALGKMERREGEITLRAGAFWKRYDLSTGVRIASSEDAVPPRLSIAPVILEASRQALITPVTGVKISITAALGAVVTIEYADAIGGPWKVLTVTDSQEFVDVALPGQRFYRVKLGGD